MKKIVIPILLALMLASCSQPGFEIKIDISDIEGKKLMLNQQVDGEYVVVDSLTANTDSKKNLLTGAVERPEIMILSIEGYRRPVMLIVENTGYTVGGTADSPEVESTSKLQQEFSAYQDEQQQIIEQLTDLNQEYRSALEAGEEEKVENITAQLDEVYRSYEKYDSIFIMENPESFVSLLALRGSYYRYNMEDFEFMLGQIDESYHDYEDYKFMKGKLEKMKKVAVGNPYLDFGLETPEGKILKISDVHDNNVLLIDFWASWCGPCRRANPELVALYNEFHDQGFDILGVSLDRDREGWLQAVEDDGLVWDHISDLKYWGSEGAELYGVSSIPHAVLVDRMGIIRAKKLHGEELREMIATLLNE